MNKSSARDITRGRQGGRWADLGADTLVDELAAARDAHTRRHTDTPCDQRRIDTGKAPECPWCHPELHDQAIAGPGASVSPDEDLARMAAAKAATGGEPTALERAALAAFPNPARLTIDGYK